MQHLQPNTSLQGGKYKIIELLGQGGFGNTYIATNTEFEETVAIKEFFMKGVTEREETTSMVRVSNIDNVPQFEEQREKFKKEARRLRKLKNEHIVKVHDLFEENGTAYYVMDYIDGTSLSERMAQTGTPFSEAETTAILGQMLCALKEIHQKSIWHLDLKPGNIMIDKQGKAYLIDFGASKQIRANGKMTTSTALCYTRGYAPPEQVGQTYEHFGPWTDIYALGATLYKLLTNERPPMTVDIEENEDAAFAFPDGISAEIRNLVVWMMQPKRKFRPQSVDEILPKIHLELTGNGYSQLKDEASQESISSHDAGDIHSADKAAPVETELSEPNAIDDNTYIENGGIQFTEDNEVVADASKGENKTTGKQQATSTHSYNAPKQGSKKDIAKDEKKTQPHYCRRCGTALKPYQIYCHRCGTKVSVAFLSQKVP